MGRFTPTRIETWTNYVGSILEDITEGMIYLLTWETVDIGDDVNIDDITYSGGGLGFKIQNHSCKPVSGFEQSHNDFEPAVHLCLF